MKPKYQSRIVTKGLTPTLVRAASLLAVSSASVVHASTWNTNANGNWSEAVKWTGGIPNAIDAVADFSTLDISARTITLDQDATVGTISLNDTGAGGDAGWTISGSKILTLATTSGAPVINLGSPNGNISDTISVALKGTQGLTVNATSSTGNQASLTLSGSLAELSGALTVNGGRVSNNGGTTLGGITSVTVASGGQIGLWGGGTYTQDFTIAGTGYGETNYDAAIRGGDSGKTTTISGLVTLAGNATVGAVGGGGLTLTNAIGESAAGSRLTIGQANLNGTVTLSGNNTYTGGTTINTGTLRINSIKNVGGGNSSLGAVTTVANGTIDIGSGSTGATLAYTGTSDTTDRVINLAGTTGGATLDQSGTGLLKFTSAFTATGAGSKNLTLQGSTTGSGEISGTIVDNSATFKTSLVKNGSGTWTLSGNNTYSGGTNITGGTLAAGSDGAFGASKIRMGGGTIASADGTARTIFTGQQIDFAGSSTFGTATTGNLKFTDDVTLGNSAKIATINNAVTEFAGIVADTGTGNNDFTKAGNGTLILSGANTYTFHKTVLNAGTLALDYSTNDNSKLADGVALILNGGTLTLAGDKGALGDKGTHTEVVGSTILGGATTLNRSGTNTASIALGAITRNAGGTLEVASSGLATTTTANVNDILEGVTLGGALATKDGSNNIVAYTGFTTVDRQGGTLTSDATKNIQITEAGSSGDVSVVPPSPSTTTDINTLSNAATGGVTTVNIGTGNTLRLGKVGTIIAGTAGLGINGGTLTAGTNGAINTTGEILVTNQSATATVIGSAIANNGTGVVSLTKSGTGTLTLTGTNTYTGGTVIAGGTLEFKSALDQSRSGVISGAGALIKSEAGKLTLSTSNTYTGGTLVKGGVLDLAVGGGAGAIRGVVTVEAGATLKASVKDAIGYSVGTQVSTLNLNGGTFDNAFNDNQGYATNVILTGGTITSTGGGAFNFNTGFGITSNASSTTSLISGNIAIRGGDLSVAVAQGTTASGVDLNISGVISVNGGSGLTKSGTGTLTLTNTNTYTGTTTIKNGTLQLAAAGDATNLLSTSTTLVLGDSATQGRLLLGSATAWSDQEFAGLTSTGQGGSIVSAHYASDAYLTINLASGTNTCAGKIGGSTDTENSIRLIKKGAGTLELSGANTYTGGTSIEGGTLQINDGGSLASGEIALGNAVLQYNRGTAATVTNTLKLGGSSGDTLRLKSIGTGAIVYAGNTAATFGSERTLALGGASTANNTFSGIIANSSDGGIVFLTKEDAGKWVLTGANTYTGKTTISGGSLALGAGGSINNTSEIALGGGNLNVSAVSGYALGAAQSLTGSGSVTGDVTINGTLAIGNSPGTITFNNNLTLEGVSNFEITSAGFAPGTYDLAQGGGGIQTVNFGGILNLFFNENESFSSGSIVKIFDFENYAGTFDEVNIFGLDLGAGQTATFNAPTGILTVVPEPGTVLLGSLGVLALLRRRRH